MRLASKNRNGKYGSLQLMSGVGRCKRSLGLYRRSIIWKNCGKTRIEAESILDSVKLKKNDKAQILI